MLWCLNLMNLDKKLELNLMNLDKKSVIFGTQITFNMICAVKSLKVKLT